MKVYWHSLFNFKEAPRFEFSELFWTRSKRCNLIFTYLSAWISTFYRYFVPFLDLFMKSHSCTKPRTTLFKTSMTFPMDAKMLMNCKSKDMYYFISGKGKMTDLSIPKLFLDSLHRPPGPSKPSIIFGFFGNPRTIRNSVLS